MITITSINIFHNHFLIFFDIFRTNNSPCRCLLATDCTYAIGKPREGAGEARAVILFDFTKNIANLIIYFLNATN